MIFRLFIVFLSLIVSGFSHPNLFNELNVRSAPETVEKFESFLEKNPSLAKTMRYGVEGINGVLMATGVKGLLTSGLPKALVALGFGEALSTASSWAGGKVEGMVADVATSETEAQRFMKALKICAETAGVVVGIKIATKTAKSLKASKIQSPVIKDALSERPIIKDGKVWLGETELGEAAALNKAPYNPRKMEALLKQGGSEVTSSTLPGQFYSNVKLAGKCKERTIIINPETQETLTQRVTFDQRGFPVFDPHIKYETRITGDLEKMLPNAHKRAATRQLRVDIEAGKVDRSIFTPKQFAQINHGLEKIEGYTWHHHQNTGRMQLVPEDIHEWVRHIGGDALWGIKK